MTTLFTRREAFVLIGGALFTSMFPVSVHAGRLRDAVTNLIEGTYKDDIEDMEQDEVDDLAQDVVHVSKRVRQSEHELRSHVTKTWESTSPGRGHTERCPYCISVAQEVEQGNPNLTPVSNKIPRCFYINRIPYVASAWGTLHRYLSGVVGPAEGYIVFQGGRYYGISGSRIFLAAPAC